VACAGGSDGGIVRYENVAPREGGEISAANEAKCLRDVTLHLYLVMRS